MKLFQLNDFSPDYFHPYYFIRKNLLIKIKENASYIKGRVLDFGCGRKPYKYLFTTDEYIGIDYENKGHSHDEEDIDVYYNGKTIPFENNYFDSVITTEVFEHVFNLDEVLKELFRVLKPGGNLLITCPFVWNEHEIPHDYARYTQFALADLLKKNGFSILVSDKSGNYITTLFQLWNLYFFRKVYFKCNKFFITRFLYKYVLVLFINITGVVFNKILPKDDSLYLNNIVVAGKNS